MIEMIEQARTC